MRLDDENKKTRYIGGFSWVVGQGFRGTWMQQERDCRALRYKPGISLPPEPTATSILSGKKARPPRRSGGLDALTSCRHCVLCPGQSETVKICVGNRNLFINASRSSYYMVFGGKLLLNAQFEAKVTLWCGDVDYRLHDRRIGVLVCEQDAATAGNCRKQRR